MDCERWRRTRHGDFRDRSWTFEVRRGGLGWIEQGLRIERDVLTNLRRADFARLQPVYKHKKARAFLAAMEEAVKELRASGQQTKRPIGHD